MIASRLTPIRTQRLAQAGFAVVLTVAAVLMLGPFQGLEQKLGLNDKAAHVIAFWGLTVGLFLCAARARRTDLALWILGFGVAIELIQGLVGRSMSLEDLACDAVGILAALIPGFIETLRRHVRANPYMTFAEIARQDRRRKRRSSVRAPRPATASRRAEPTT